MNVFSNNYIMHTSAGVGALVKQPPMAHGRPESTRTADALATAGTGLRWVFTLVADIAS
jgi:hypothetical protein